LRNERELKDTRKKKMSRFLHEPLFLIVIGGGALLGLLAWWNSRSQKR